MADLVELVNRFESAHGIYTALILTEASGFSAPLNEINEARHECDHLQAEIDYEVVRLWLAKR